MKEIIKGITSGGSFCAGGKAQGLPAPGLYLDGVGDVAVPLLSCQIDAIKSVASQAPYGKGAQTVVDTTVRNCLQVDPALVKMNNPQWATGLKMLVRSVAEELGVQPDHVDASLYKVLLYEKGGHFKSHRDTEKAPGMFATLVVQFPSSFVGGAIVVRHGGTERILKMGSDDGSSCYEFFYSAHYADCEHEIQEITSGYRLAAVYSLCRKGDGSPPAPISIEAAVKICDKLQNLTSCKGILLEHEYTGASLARYGVRALKGKDRAIADSLLSAQALLEQKDPSKGLVLHIVRAIRRVAMEDGGDSEDPVLDLKEGSAFRMDGSEASSNVMNFLKPLKFYGDIINHCEDNDSASDEEEPINDKWWRDSEGAGVERWGNEGSGETTTYSCYIISLWTRNIEFDLVCKTSLVKALEIVRSTSNTETRAELLKKIGSLIKAGMKCDETMLEGMVDILLDIGAKELIKSVLDLIALPGGLGQVNGGYQQRSAVSSPLFGIGSKRTVDAISKAVNGLGWEFTAETVQKLLEASEKSAGGNKQWKYRLLLLVQIFHTVDEGVWKRELQIFVDKANTEIHSIDEECFRYAMELMFKSKNQEFLASLIGGVSDYDGKKMSMAWTTRSPLVKALRLLSKRTQNTQQRENIDIKEEILLAQKAWNATQDPQSSSDAIQS